MSVALLSSLLALVQEPAPIPRRWAIIFESDDKLKSTSPHNQGTRDLGDVPKIALDAYRRSSLSPDGKTWACVSTEDGDAEIWFCNSDGSNPKRVTSNTDIDNMPCWQADGRRLFFASTQSGMWQIWVVSSDGKDPQKLTDARLGAWEPRCSPDGNLLARLEFTSTPPSPPFNLVVSKLDGTERRTLLEQTTLREYAWSPDGSAIACSLPGEVLIIDPKAGDTIHRVKLEDVDPELSSTVAMFPTWRPDGKELAASLQIGRKNDPDPRLNGLLLWPLNGKATVLPMHRRARVHGWKAEK